MSRMVIAKFEDNDYFLSNFFEFPVEFTTPDDNFVTFVTNEHAFQAAKYKAMTGNDEEKLSYVQSLAKHITPTEAKRLGRKVKIDINQWESMRIDVMREICMVKFSNDLMTKRLLDTGDAMLVEGNTWGDKFWGRCDGAGYNMLGVILMEIRGYYRLQPQQSPIKVELDPSAWS